MKFSIFTVSTPELSPEQLVTSAREAGVEAVEWRFKEIPQDALQEEPSYWRHNRCSIDPAGSEEEWLTFKQIAEKENIRTLAVVPYLSCGDIENTRRVLRAAQLLGADYIRAGVPAYDRSANYNTLFHQCKEYLAQVEGLAAEYGVKALVETHHNTIAPSASLAHRLVSQFNPEHIGVLYDPGNMVYEGYENYKMGLELLGPYLAHVHVKNAAHVSSITGEGDRTEWKQDWSPLAQGAVSWPQVLADLKSVGYDGYFGIEDFSGTLASPDMMKSIVEQMKEWSA
ncbi:sugar phosphate isomerase/epimerase family protein [Paenibacillus lemnae]|uniref:Sugar phosphate isomerase/epimerase n=1 Tax=Paenibacillus lemnae TaxID=1330551 RepID=A0A848M5J0_PAELE|nr:sugar phosphate isomerase/epimerase family protein [Paenibacillus lemnae]NMO94874.1 sugar phosphate isomerase/epimerase [Paenibacillus lemnae]